MFYTNLASAQQPQRNRFFRTEQNLGIASLLHVIRVLMIERYGMESKRFVVLFFFVLGLVFGFCRSGRRTIEESIWEGGYGIYNVAHYYGGYDVNCDSMRFLQETMP